MSSTCSGDVCSALTNVLCIALKNVIFGKFRVLLLSLSFFQDIRILKQSSSDVVEATDFAVADR